MNLQSSGSKPKPKRILHLYPTQANHLYVFLMSLARKLSRGDSSSVELDIFTLDLAQQNRVLYT